jgi:HK97 family phage portal protein
MSLLARIDQRIRAADTQGSYGPINDFWYNSVPTESNAGVSVTPENAMRNSTVWKCVRWKSRQFAKVPKKMYERVFKFGRWSREEALDHPLYSIVHKRPNPVEPSFAFFEKLSQDLDLYGNFYAFIQTNDFGRPKYLWRLRPDRCRIQTRVVFDGNAPGGKRTELVYYFTDETGEEHPFFEDEILHVRGLGFDGIRGYSPIRMLMNNIGWNVATERYGALFFRNASRPSGVLSSPGVIKEPQKSELIAQLTKSGRNAGSLMLVEGALEYNKLSFDQDEAQFIQTIEMQQEDICGEFEVMPHKIGILRHTNNSTLENQNIEAATDTLHPLCERVEQWFEYKLLRDSPSSGIGGGREMDRFFMECELKGMMRGDTAARTAFYVAMRNIGVMSANDIRVEENMPLDADGDIYVMQSGFATVGRIADGTATKAGQQPGKPVTKPQQDKAINNPTKAIAAAPVDKVFEPLFKDAVGRAMHRTRIPERQKLALQVFQPLLASLAKACDFTYTTEFMSNYLTNLGTRIAGAPWENSDVQGIAEAELQRAIGTFSNGGVYEK